MTTRTITRTTYAIEIDGEEIHTEYAPSQNIDPHLSDDGNTLYYAVDDWESRDDYWDDEQPGGVEFREFRNAWDRDEFFEEEASDPLKAVYIVGKYEHGLVQYCVHGERWFPDMQFDYAPSGVLVLSVDPTDDYHFTDPKAAAVAILADYTAWCNGEVYGIATMVRTASGDWVPGDAVFGFIGSDYAQQAVNEEHI